MYVHTGILSNNIMAHLSKLISVTNYVIAFSGFHFNMHRLKGWQNFFVLRNMGWCGCKVHVGGLGASSPRKIWISRVSEIASGAICEARMHYAEVLGLWCICIIKSVCGLLNERVIKGSHS